EHSQSRTFVALRPLTKLLSGMFNAGREITNPHVLAPLGEELRVEVDSQPKRDVVEVGVAEVVADELVLARALEGSTVEDDAARAPGERAADDVSVPGEPPLEIGVRKVASFEPNVAEIADRCSAEGAVSKERTAVGERKPLNLHVGEVTVDEAAALGQEGVEAKPGKVHSLSGYARELDVQGLRLEPHVAQVGGDPCLLWPGRAFDLTGGRLELGVGGEETC